MIVQRREAPPIGLEGTCSKTLQNKSLRKTHCRNCLILAQEKEDKDKERARVIKQKMGREENVKMLTNTKYVVKDPHSSQVLKVQRVQYGVVCEYTTKEGVERVVYVGGV